MNIAAHERTGVGAIKEREGASDPSSFQSKGYQWSPALPPIFRWCLVEPQGVTIHSWIRNMESETTRVSLVPDNNWCKHLSWSWVLVSYCRPNELVLEPSGAFLELLELDWDL